MAKTITISRAGHLVGAMGIPETIRALAQQQVKFEITSKYPQLTDNSGGIASAVLNLAPNPADTPVAGSNLASSADITAALTTMQNALATIAPAFNALAGGCGFAPIVWSGGGSAGGAVPAIGKTFTGSAVGVSTSVLSPMLNLIDRALYNYGNLINRAAIASGGGELSVNPTHEAVLAATAIPALVVNPGANNAAGTPGVAAADMVAIMTAYANDIASLVSAYNTVTSPGVLRVLAVR